MKTDVIIIANDGRGMDAVLSQAEKMAAYKCLSHKNALHLRLLTEEMVSMMRSITGTAEGRFWIEDEAGTFRLHLKTETFVDFDKREKLLSVSSTGKNEAARGIMGKIRTFFDPLDGLYIPASTDSGDISGTMSWSMRAYQEEIQRQMNQNQAGAKEAWDELEKSVVTHVADDIKVSIQGREVELILEKKMEP